MFAGPFALPPGSLISISTHLFYRHFGIVTERGTVISNSTRHRGAREETLAEFCDGKPWRLEPRPSDLTWWVVLARARQLMSKPYNLFTWNCESFVTSAYGLAPRSDQVAVSVLVAAVGLIAAMSFSNS